MNFDLDDPLGSDDSFFEEPKALSRRASTKSVEKKSVENLFNLLDSKPNVDSTKTTPQKSRHGVTFDESTIKQDDASKPAASEFGAKVPKKRNEDWLGSIDSGGQQERKGKKTDFLEDLLYGPPTSPKEKKVVPPEVSVKDNQLTTPSKSASSLKEPSTPTDVTSSFSIFSNTSRERRRPRRGSSSGFEDALGLFSDDYHTESKPSVPKIGAADVQVKPTRLTEKGVPDWLGGSSAASVKPDVQLTKKPAETEEPAKESSVVDEQNALPKNEDNPRKSPITTKESKDSDISLSLKQQQINSDLQNTYSSLQQQETLLLISLQLKKYEENLDAIKRQQKELLEKQEKRFDTVLDKYALRQQVIENNIRMQQERLNNHVQLLISQPIVNSDKDNSDGNEVVKTSNDSDMESLIRSLKQKHNEELFVLEESYKKQISVLEKSSEALEDRLRNEINNITSIFEDKIENINRNHNEEVQFYKQKISTMEEQQLRDIQLMKDHHARILEEIREEYRTHIEYLKQFSKKENELLTNGQFYSQKLDTSIELLSNSTKLLEGVQEKITHNSDIISVARQSSIEAREKEIILMRNSLEKCREAAETERSQLLALIRSLETKIAEQNINAQEDRWALQQASATLAARSAALEREIEYTKTINEREREQIKTLKASMLAEQEKMVVQLTEEKLKLSAEKARIETSSKLSNNYESEKIKAEAEMAIQVAKELSQKVTQEREFLYRQKNDIETLRRELSERERELQDKEINLEYLIENTQRKISEDKRIINEAKKLENKYKERLQELQSQWASLADREKKLAEEKVLLSKERLTLYTTMKQTKSCALCKGSDLPIHGNNYYVEDNLSNLKMAETNASRMRIDTLEDEGSSEVSRGE